MVLEDIILSFLALSPSISGKVWPQYGYSQLRLSCRVSFSHFFKSLLTLSNSSAGSTGFSMKSSTGR